ncbi:hypothetical protein ScPMuIL_011517 [Solemya velum]
MCLWAYRSCPRFLPKVKNVWEVNQVTKISTKQICPGCHRNFSSRRAVTKHSLVKKIEVLVNEHRYVSTSCNWYKDEQVPPSTPSPSPSSTESKTSKIVKVTKKKPLEYSYTGNIFILPVRAMNEYLLTPADLNEIPKYTRRSPYDGGPRITMFLRTDVEKAATKAWGSLDKMKDQKQKFIAADKMRYANNFFQLRAMIEEHTSTGRLQNGKPFVHSYEEAQKDKDEKKKSIWQTGSGKVVLSAVMINALNSAIKCIAWIHTGSHSMFSEFIHSVADTVNQIILGLGLAHSIREPDSDHPYGYTNLRHIASLISGVGIFCFGTGLSFYHGIQGFLHPQEMGPLLWVCRLFISQPTLVRQGEHFIAVNQVKKSAKLRRMKFWQYVWRGHDPSVNVVLLEDLAAVIGVGIAATCMTLTHITGSPFADSLGSILIGGLLGTVASFIIYTNTQSLVGRSIPSEVKGVISHDLEKDRMIRSLHDVKATEMGGEVRFKAEVDFDGREITRAYLYRLDLDEMLAELKELQTTSELELFMLTHGERIIDMLGEEVDRIEKIMKEKHPELRHVDLEAL